MSVHRILLTQKGSGNMADAIIFKPYRTNPLDGWVNGQDQHYKTTGLSVKLRHPLTMIEVMCIEQNFGKFANIIDKQFGLRPDKTPCSAQYLGESAKEQIKEKSLLWLSPYQFLLVSNDDAHDTNSFKVWLAASLPAQPSMVDQSHGKVCFRIQGALCRHLLAQGSHMDCSGQGLPIHQCHTTKFFQLAAHIHCINDECFDIYTPRSFALHLFQSLCHGAQFAAM